MTRAELQTTWGMPDAPLRLAVLLLAFAGVLFVNGGCASRQHQPTQVEDDGGIERPAGPVSDEEGLTDTIGEVGVVLLVVSVTIGLILLPILLF